MFSTNGITNKKIIQWAVNSIKSHGYILKSEIPQKVQRTPWSDVVRFATTEGYIYLKTTPPKLGLEAIIIQTLEQQFAASVPKIIDSNAELSCFLMTDAGQSLREILKTNFDEKLFCRAIKQFTALQLSVAERVAILLDIGVPDWRLNKFADLYAEVVSANDLLIADGLTETEIIEAADLVDKVAYLAEQLSVYPIKQTMVQPDFNDNNTLINHRTQVITMIDLGEIVISHPFFSLLNCLYQIKKHHRITEQSAEYLSIKNACFAAYLQDEVEGNVSTAIAIAEKLWMVYHILAMHRLIMACNRQEIMSVLRGRLSGLFRDCLKSLPSW